jgi:D-3-phosphoglycerate dehydrogenase
MSQIFKALVTELYTQESLTRLKQELNCKVILADKLKAAEVKDCDLLLIRSKTKVTPGFLKGFSKLKLIVTATSGYDHIDLDACKNANVKVAHTKNANAQSAAEQTLFLILAALKNARPTQEHLLNGLWRTGLPLNSELGSKKVGIVGLGRVGFRVSQLIKAFGAEVGAYDPYVGDTSFVDAGILRMGFTELIKWADLISVHVPLTKETRHMFKKSVFLEMNTDTVFVNTSRGEVVNEDDLYEALKTKQIHAAALDVFEREPTNKDTKIISLKNVFGSTHQGGYTIEALSRASLEAVTIATDFFRSGVLKSELT